MRKKKKKNEKFFLGNFFSAPQIFLQSHFFVQKSRVFTEPTANSHKRKKKKEKKKRKVKKAGTRVEDLLNPPPTLSKEKEKKKQIKRTRQNLRRSLYKTTLLLTIPVRI